MAVGQFDNIVIDENNKKFFERQFWYLRKKDNEIKEDNETVNIEEANTLSETIPQKNRESAEGAKIFLDRSNDYYWEKAYLEFLKQNKAHIKGQDHAANTMEFGMDFVYSACNLFNAVAPLFKPFLHAVPGVGAFWNFFDSIGAGAIALREGKKGDKWAANANLASAAQVTLGTVFATMVDYPAHVHGMVKYLVTHMAGHAVGLSALASGASGITFAAAMAFSCALEHREVKLHQARIDHIDKQIVSLQNKINEIKKEYNPLYYPENYSAMNVNTEAVNEIISNIEKALICKIPNNNEIVDQNDKQQALTKYIEENPKDKDVQNLQDHKDLLKLRDFRTHQVEQLKVHKDARTVWGLCTVLMTAVAITSIVVVALGASALTWGLIAPAVASGCALLISALVRHYKHPPVKKDTIKKLLSNCFLNKKTDKKIDINNTNPPLITSAPPNDDENKNKALTN